MSGSGILIGLGTVLLVGMTGLATSCSPIDTGNVGVITHFGEVQNQILDPGLNFVRPFFTASVIKVSTAVSTTEHEAKAASKDLQGVHTKVSVQWSVEKFGAPLLCQGFGYGDGAWTNGIISPAIQEVVKAVSAQFTAEQLITQRNKVKEEIEKGLAEFINKTLTEKKSKGAIRIANVAITDFDFSPEFNQSIEAKVKAEQDALKAVNEKNKRITNAEADFAEKKLAADGQAYTIEKESIMRSAAIERESKALQGNPQLIQLRATERWNGVLPTFNGGSNPVPFIQLDHKQ